MERLPMNKILRRPAVEERVGLSCSTIYVYTAEGRFPKPIKIGKRAVGWPENTVETWLAERAAQTSKAA